MVKDIVLKYCIFKEIYIYILLYCENFKGTNPDTKLTCIRYNENEVDMNIGLKGNYLKNAF